MITINGDDNDNTALTPYVEVTVQRRMVIKTPQ